MWKWKPEKLEQLLMWILNVEDDGLLGFNESSSQ